MSLRRAHLRGDAAAELPIATAFVAIGDPVNGDCAAGLCATGCRSPEMNRNSLLLGATGDRIASLARDGLSATGDGTGDLHQIDLIASRITWGNILPTLHVASTLLETRQHCQLLATHPQQALQQVSGMPAQAVPELDPLAWPVAQTCLTLCEHRGVGDHAPTRLRTQRLE